MQQSTKLQGLGLCRPSSLSTTPSLELVWGWGARGAGTLGAKKGRGTAASQLPPDCRGGPMGESKDSNSKHFSFSLPPPTPSQHTC